MAVPYGDVHHPGGSQLLDQFGSERCGLRRTTPQASTTAPRIHLKTTDMIQHQQVISFYFFYPEQNYPDEKTVRLKLGGKAMKEELCYVSLDLEIHHCHRPTAVGKKIQRWKIIEGNSRLHFFSTNRSFYSVQK